MFYWTKIQPAIKTKQYWKWKIPHTILYTDKHCASAQYKNCKLNIKVKLWSFEPCEKKKKEGISHR